GSSSFDGKPADLLMLGGINLRAKCFCNHLGAEANAKHGLARTDGLAQQGKLWPKPGILYLIVHTHWAAHDRQRLERGQRRQSVPLIETDDRNRRAPGCGPICDGCGSLERDVL